MRSRIKDFNWIIIAAILVLTIIVGTVIRRRDNASYVIEHNGNAYGTEEKTISTVAPARKYIANGKININYADADMLETLEGIGDEMANRIIDYRNKNGAFGQIEEIMNVTGIGKTKFEKIKDRITVEEVE